VLAKLRAKQGDEPQGQGQTDNKRPPRRQEGGDAQGDDRKPPPRRDEGESDGEDEEEGPNDSRRPPPPKNDEGESEGEDEEGEEAGFRRPPPRRDDDEEEEEPEEEGERRQPPQQLAQQDYEAYFDLNDPYYEKFWSEQQPAYYFNEGEATKIDYVHGYADGYYDGLQAGTPDYSDYYYSDDYYYGSYDSNNYTSDYDYDYGYDYYGTYTVDYSYYDEQGYFVDTSSPNWSYNQWEAWTYTGDVHGYDQVYNYIGQDGKTVFYSDLDFDWSEWYNQYYSNDYYYYY
jgi:hypothetical protein